MTPLEYLFSLEFHGIKLGLENIARLLGAANDPQARYPTIHVGGTNGKGSTVAILDAIFRAAGYRVGRFTSPHLCNVSERFLVNGAPIPADELDRLIEKYRGLASVLENPPTFFEINTAIAFSHFLESGIDVALIEVGLGGRFDSTNVITPLVSVITNISLEHTQYLGSTLEAIAFEKAGIVKPNVPLVLGEPQPGPQRVILDRARELAAPARLLGREFHVKRQGPALEQRIDYSGPVFSLREAPLALAGAHQADNAALAVAAVECILPHFPRIGKDTLRAGLAAASWPCRLERVLDSPPVYIDVAHNPAGMKALVASLPGPCAVVLAIASDKDASAMIQTLAPFAAPLILAKFTGGRALAVEELRKAAGGLPCLSAPDLGAAIELGLEHASPSRPLLITGSLFTAGEARTYLVERHGARPMRF